MNVDLTPEEMRYIMETIGAGDTSKPVVSSVIHKMADAAKNFRETDQPQPEAGTHAKVGYDTWKSPI